MSKNPKWRSNQGVIGLIDIPLAFHRPGQPRDPWATEKPGAKIVGGLALPAVQPEGDREADHAEGRAHEVHRDVRVVAEEGGMGAFGALSRRGPGSFV